VRRISKELRGNKKGLGIIQEEKEKDFSFMNYNSGDLGERFKRDFATVLCTRDSKQTQTQNQLKNKGTLLQSILYVCIDC
jgi:hypothetical protein